MAIIWHESLFHTGARSRDTQDMRFFSYIWAYVLSSSRNRSKGSIDSVAREIDYQVYHNNITTEIYKDLYTLSPKCLYCRKLEEIIDLRDILPKSYAPGDRIIGCLDSLVWVVIRCI